MNKRILVFFTSFMLFAPFVFADELQDAKTALANDGLKIAKLNFEALIAENRKDVAAYLGLAKIQLMDKEFDAATVSLKTGLKYARDRTLKLDLWATAIRVENARGNTKKARKYYRKAKSINGSKKHAEVNLAMAITYIKMKQFDDAGELLRLVLSLDSTFSAEAEQTLTNLQLIEKAIVITNSDFAYAASLNREQVANLLVSSMGISTKIGEIDLSQVTVGERSDQGLTDYADSEYRDDILNVHRLGLRSLRIRNGAFSPENAITRMELALLIEDVLFVKFGVSRTKYIGSESPFSDLSSNSTGFNAIMTAVTRGLMHGNANGRIFPNELVSGAEAILVLHNLESILNQPTQGD